MSWLYRSKTPTHSRPSSWCTTWKLRKCWVSMKTLPKSWPLCLKRSVICSAMLRCTMRFVGGVGDVVRCWCSLVKSKQHACLLRISAWKQKVLLLYKNDDKKYSLFLYKNDDKKYFFCIKIIKPPDKACVYRPASTFGSIQFPFKFKGSELLLKRGGPEVPRPVAWSWVCPLPIPVNIVSIVCILALLGKQVLCSESLHQKFSLTQQ